jgi:SAM-dependent methyltransferase
MTNQEFYDLKLKTEQNTIKQVGWENVDKAILRYRRIADILHDVKCSSVVDYGCGLGDFVNYVPRGIEYTGVDVHESYIEKAQLIHPKELFFTIVGNGKINECDWAINIGAWTLNGGKSHEDYWNDIVSQVSKMLTYTKCGLIVNGFHKSVDFEDPKLFYHDMNEWFKLAKYFDGKIEIELFQKHEFILKIYQD